MATKRSQRIGIWIIAIAMVAGTLGGFLVMVLAPKNQAADQARLEELQGVYSKEYEAYQAKVKERDAAITAPYYETFKSFEGRAVAFNADEVTELRTEDLLVGDGAEVTDETKFSAFYILWLPDGTIKEKSLTDDGTLNMPIDIADGLKNASLIDGWKEGMIGMKLGGVRELTVPSDKAYKETGSADGGIAPNTPLKFIVMAVPTPDKGEEIAVPKMSAELKKLHSQINGIDPRILEGM